MPHSLVDRKAELLAQIDAAADPPALEEVEIGLFGRQRGVVTAALRELGQLPDVERRVRGIELNALKQELSAALEKRKGVLLQVPDHELREREGFDATVVGDLPPSPRGHQHPVTRFLQEVEDVFGRMGFEAFEGPEIETEDLNFTLLNIPPDHPARDMQATFWLQTPPGEERRVLRTHTSPGQIRYMRSHRPPFRMICAGRVYRRDADATHSPVFHQVEGLMVDRAISLAHMKGVMVAAMQALLSPNIAYRFRQSYFPFTEPSLEMDIAWDRSSSASHAARQGTGELVPAKSRRSEAKTGGDGWLEVAGCGLVHPQVLRNVKIDPKKWSGFAFGFGIDRLVMIRHRIPDIRLLYSGDLKFLEQF